MLCLADANNERCSVSVTTPVTLSVSEFNTEGFYDYITTSATGSTRFSGSSASTIAAINAIQLGSGGTITWSVSSLQKTINNRTSTSTITSAPPLSVLEHCTQRLSYSYLMTPIAHTPLSSLLKCSCSAQSLIAAHTMHATLHTTGTRTTPFCEVGLSSAG